MSDSIRHLVEEAVKSAMRERNKEKTSTLRMALSELKKEEIDRREEITNEDSIKILQRMIKQRKESKTQFLDAGRSELANKENEEILILQDFLPEQLSEEAIKVIVLEAISETQAKEPQDMGKVMGALKSKIKGNADMGIVSKIVKENL
ncbi:MAG: GatB/YqeY domain-containing protein [SAR86 cluster bacterium]|nr:GatB/YqeY domain-containing protein [SAR86 cluster bacterium]MDG1680579.1 GatB/YqeY domain-containing protein [SAR86 cluster bacterium]